MLRNDFISKHFSFLGYNQSYLLARDTLTVSLFLPLALLAANTRLPFGVDILSRKPCLFLFFLSDGWNVLFITVLYYRSVIILLNFQIAKIG